MFRVIPTRRSLWRAGWAMLTLSLIAYLVSANLHRLMSPALPTSRYWEAGALMYALIFASAWVGANGIWSKWRLRALEHAAAEAQAPATRVRWTWTMKQLVAGVFFLVVGIWLSSVIGATTDDDARLIIGVAIGLGTIGMTYLLLARRIGKLERGQGVVYYWRRQPGVFSFERVGVSAVPVHAVLT